MASSSRRRNDVDRLCLTSDAPHFFKIVLAHTLKEQKLEIPKKFVREHGLNALFHDQTCLKVAGGAEWNVGLSKSKESVWFENGWQEFVEFYSVRFGYFLVFRYESQSSSFHVVIFDHSATEIQYPVKNFRLDEAEKRVEMAIEYYKDFQVGGGSSGGVKTMNGEHGWKKPPPTASQRARAMEKATDFKSRTLNPSFMCKIWPSHLHPGKCLNIPRSFAEMHVKEPTAITLQVSDGRMWSSRFCVSRSRTIGRMTQLRGGWRRFACDNNLQVGDFCVFEMIRKNSRRISLKVAIFRVS